VIASTYLDEYDDQGPFMRLRIFDPHGQLQQNYDGDHFLDDIEAGKLFGTSDVILSIQTGGARSYLQHTLIWLLPDAGKPKQLLEFRGALQRFQPTGSGLNGLPGVWTELETFDGVHAETRGRKPEFRAWDENQKALTLAPGVLGIPARNNR
jgi:hypothetical protein